MIGEFFMAKKDNMRQKCMVDAVYFVNVYRVVRGEKLNIMFITFIDDETKVYGGVRYTNDMDEKEIVEYIVAGVFNGIYKPTTEMEHHRLLGRKIERRGCAVTLDVN